MSDVNDLLARLKNANGSNGGDPRRSASAMSGIQQPQAQSPGVPKSLYGMASPPPPGLTNIGAATEKAQSDRTTSLLNLLKFNQPGSGDANHQRAVSSSSAQAKSPGPSTAVNPQEALLKLLSRPNPNTTIENKAPAAPAPVVPKTSTTQVKGPVFTHVNPFDDLAATAPTTGNDIPSISGKGPAQAGDTTRSSKAPTPLPDGRTQVEALLGIGAKSKEQETVTGALAQAGEQAREEASDAVERAETDIARAQEKNPHAVEDAMQEAAADIREDLKDEATRERLEHDMPPEMIKGFEDTIERVASGQDVADSWESAEAEESADDARFYTFPMKPFVTIDIKSTSPSPPRVREDIVMKVASMKREFDQVDRTLAAATTNHIVYAMTKGGGFRVIRQDDGSNKHVFKKSGTSSSVYNISVMQSEHKQPEPILATAVDGSVYWTEVPSDADGFVDTDLDARGFQMPPLTSQEDSNTSGAQVKTRAKLSTRNPDFFALGRGKSIYVVWPRVAMRSRYFDEGTRVVDSEKYFAERSLKIATGKAGKDFAFSQDDSVLVSLDKAGRVKFWELKEFTDPEFAASESPTVRQIDVKIPLMTLQISQPEKSWATSVQFVDKDRPFNKGQALRYLLVGSKQNHTLTLWDIGLGKAVQEVNFPQENDTDPICSITYNAKSSVIVVGHPKRNSVYLIHLSAPKYNLSSMSQADFVERVSRSDPNLPRPASTAIMSGLREVSLDGLGTLRSLSINNPESTDDVESRILELYIMHSKGVTCLNLERQDLGIGKDGKPLNPVDGKDAKVINWRDFETPVQGAPSSEASSSKPPQSPVVKPEAPSSAKKLPVRPREVEAAPSTNAKEAASATTAPEMAEKRPTAPVTFASMAARGNAAKPAASSTLAPPAAPRIPQRPLSPPATLAPPVVSDNATARAAEAMVQAVSTAKAPTPRPSPAPIAPTAQPIDAVQISQLSNSLSQSITQATGGLLSGILTEVLSDQLEKLYHKIDEDKRVQEASGAAKQDAVLRLVSSTLTDNVEKSLHRIVTTAIDQSVVPTVNNVVAQAVDKKIAETLTPHLQDSIPRELKSALTPAVNQAMQSPDLLRNVSDVVTKRVSGHVEEVFAATLRNSIAPSFHNLAVESARRLSKDIDGRVREQLTAFDVRANNDSAKIDQLTGLTSELLQTVRTMAGRQGELQNEILTLKTELKQYQQQATEAAAVAAQSAAVAQPPVPEAYPDLSDIKRLMASGSFEEATIKWLQSADKDEIFNDYLAEEVDPRYLAQCNQIVILSVAAAVSAGLSYAQRYARLSWLEMSLACMNAESPEIRDHAVAVMDSMTQHLQQTYMEIAEEDASDSALQDIHKLVRRAREIKMLAA